MATSTLAAAPTLAELDQMEPIEVARRLSQLARDCGTLSPELSARRDRAMAESKALSRSAVWVAEEVRLPVTTVYRLIRRYLAAVVAQTGGAQ